MDKALKLLDAYNYRAFPWFEVQERSSSFESHADPWIVTKTNRLAHFKGACHSWQSATESGILVMLQ